MSVGRVIFVVAAVVVVVAVLAWFAMQRRRPESGFSHYQAERHGSEQYHGDLGRPAGRGPKRTASPIAVNRSPGRARNRATGPFETSSIPDR
jgi:hypothetical protein